MDNQRLLYLNKEVLTNEIFRSYKQDPISIDWKSQSPISENGQIQSYSNFKCRYNAKSIPEVLLLARQNKIQFSKSITATVSKTLLTVEFLKHSGSKISDSALSETNSELEISINKVNQDLELYNSRLKTHINECLGARIIKIER